MKNYEVIDKQSFSFSNCQECEANCCDGRKGSILAPINIDEFDNVAKYFPIAFILGEEGFIQPVVLFNNGKNFCPYVKDFQCSIYENRPFVCRVYPLNPSLDGNIYIDKNCPSVNEQGNSLVANGKIAQSFYPINIATYQQRCLATYTKLSDFTDANDFEVLLDFNGAKLYRYNKQSDNTYMALHLDSLRHFNQHYLD